MELTKLTFTEIETQLNKHIQSFQPTPNHEAMWVKNSIIEFMKSQFPDKIQSRLTTGNELTLKLPGTIEVLGKEVPYKISLVYKVKTKRTGKEIKVGRIRRKYEVTKADNPFKFDRIDDLSGLDIPSYRLNKSDDGKVSVSKEGDWGSSFDFDEIKGIDDVNSLAEFNVLIKDAYELNVYNSMTQPIIKPLALNRRDDVFREKMLSTFSREHLELFFEGAYVKDICTGMVEHMKANNLIND